MRLLKAFAWVMMGAASGLAAQPGWVKPGRVETLSVAGPKVSYMQKISTLIINVPAPVKTLEDLARINPQLGTLLPGLAAMMAKPDVSPKFDALYAAKIRELKRGEDLPEEIFYDCATVLNLASGKTSRRAVLFQSDMDVVTDGSDPDRCARIEQYDEGQLDNYFQPLVGYRWDSKPQNKNPFLDFYPKEMDAIDQFAAQFQARIDGDPAKKIVGDKSFVWRSLINACKRQKGRIRELYEDNLNDLRNRRSLISALDPFIVLPGPWLPRTADGDDAYRMAYGDYVAVIYKGGIYPAIVGDAGPVFKTGEVSLKIAQTVNPKASGNIAAVSGVGVSYLVFPGTHEPKGEPNLEHFYQQVQKYLKEIGGLGEGVELHRW